MRFAIMSKNTKNVIRKGFLRNYTTKVKHRFILLEKGASQFRDIGKIICSANETLNTLIHELNIKVPSRQIPYLTLELCYGNVSNRRVRAFLHDDDTSPIFEGDIEKQIGNETEISHVLDFLIAPGFKKITIGSLSYSAELVIDYRMLKDAIVDIMLDIAMFNSYSFLKRMSSTDKKHFNEEKYAYFQAEQKRCFYDYDNPNNKTLYYSLSFSHRYGSEDFDLNGYICEWDDFIELNYPGYMHQEKSIEEQMKQHVDYKEFPKNFHLKFDKKPEGAYVVLRTNKKKNSPKIQPSINSFFNIIKFRKGKIRIIPLSLFNDYQFMMKNLDVSAFKIVKQGTAFSQISNSNDYVDLQKNSSDNKLDVQLSNETEKSSTGENHAYKENNYRFKIGVSFSSKYRDKYVEPFCRALLKLDYMKDDIFYDNWHKPLINGVDGSAKIQQIYMDDCKLIVVLLSPDYNKKKWSGIIEKSVIEYLINSNQMQRICLLRVDSASLDEFNLYIANNGIAEDIDKMTADATAKLIDDIYQTRFGKK